MSVRSVLTIPIDFSLQCRTGLPSGQWRQTEAPSFCGGGDDWEPCLANQRLTGLWANHRIDNVRRLPDCIWERVNRPTAQNS